MVTAYLPPREGVSGILRLEEMDCRRNMAVTRIESGLLMKGLERDDYATISREFGLEEEVVRDVLLNAQDAKKNDFYRLAEKVGVDISKVLY